jgi:hypothetical protein
MARNPWVENEYDSDDSDASDTEPYYPPRPPREMTESEFVDENFDEISAMYASLMDYMQTYGPCLLQTLTFDAFATFVYQNSYRV